MNKAEFDQFAEEYRTLHANNIKITGETPDFFADYKVADAAEYAKKGITKDNLSILDFGSGVGNSIPYFFKYFPSAKLSCTDVSEKSLNIAQARYPDGAEYKLFDGIALPYKSESFNIVFTACVFHHIPLSEHDALFKEILRVLKKDGVFIIFEHNPLNPLTVRGNQLRNQLREAGFNQVAHKYRVFFPGFLKALRFFEPLIGWLPLGAQYYVTGRK